MSTDNNYYVLDQIDILDILNPMDHLNFSRWYKVPDAIDQRTSLILLPGETLRLSGDLKISKDSILYIRFMSVHQQISQDRMICEIMFNDKPHSTSGGFVFITAPLKHDDQSREWRELELNLSFLKGKNGHIQIACKPGHLLDPSGDWLAVSDLVIAPQDKLSNIKAKSLESLRTRNELAHFTSTYEHEMYSDAQKRNALTAKGVEREVEALIAKPKEIVERGNFKIEPIEPMQQESPYDYAMRVLANQLGETPPNFLDRLSEKCKIKNPLRVLSICCGAARIEASFAAELGPNVNWTLLDINADLLKTAARQFAPEINLKLIQANVNELVFSGEKWDVIICISALHHVVELEKCIQFIHDSLTDDGEFWSIGENIGRCGNRLWPDALKEANNIFTLLPEKYRKNRITHNVDLEISDKDFSVDCYEGIRSEEILQIMSRWFHEHSAYTRNCFIWRLINLDYSDNYSLDNREDRNWIVEMVEAEMRHYAKGGISTELHGIYTPKKFI
jgi:SAM-dependent methyltransferase